MPKDFDEIHLRKELRRLSHAQRIAFLLLIAERFWPNYFPFFRREHWGDPEVLREAIDFGWSYLVGHETDTDLEDLIERVLDCVPDSQDFPDNEATLAESAAAIVSCLLEYLKTASVDNLVHAAQAAYGAVDAYAVSQSTIGRTLIHTPELDKAILETPLVQAELKQQWDDILLVTELDPKNVSQMKKFVHQWSNRLTSGLGIS